MKLNINLMRLIIQLSILLVMIVMFFIITMFLYSVKYWPDVYNYINANITIKRIPKISEIEINMTIYDSTDINETTDLNDFNDITTEYYGGDDYFSLDEVENRKRRRVEQDIDYSDVPTKEDIDDYIFEVQPERDLVKDLAEKNELTAKDTEDVEVLEGIFNGKEYLGFTKDCSNTTDIEENIFPWVTAIFIKNETSNQFDYYCDGALLSDTIIITAASCIQKPNATADDILVILGKRSLRDMTNDEMISKIKEVHVHDNFTGSNHDIAIIEMAEPATLSDRIQRARLSGDRGKSATTGWAISGALTLIPFEDEHIDCNETLPEKTFCAVYGNDISVCPSYGGLYATRGIDGWFLRGIRRADPTNKVFCINRSLVYTDLKYYSDWINMYVK
ncbi:chymotrypsin-like protease CTRL-1 isoform X2 [Danaus plexippus]|uniref:chymotrypsin-like protease CTRL-1 isoform X2 n=1 Tax=Danaus plexippus TaxID=13037 RepID=UPI002AB0FBDA|nr:chymotrypsin-like protease CTRL-1 isoform X2 [Danaus plexippus]